jgi:hypothetical protein
LIGERTLQLAGGGQASVETLLGISSAATEPALFQLSVMIPRLSLTDPQISKIVEALNALQMDPLTKWQVEWLGVEA